MNALMEAGKKKQKPRITLDNWISIVYTKKGYAYYERKRVF